MGISVIKKRDGRIVPFDVQRITEAIEKSFRAVDPRMEDRAVATSLALEVYTRLDTEGNPAPTVDAVQSAVEQVLLDSGYPEVAKSYLVFRQERSLFRAHELPASEYTGGDLSLTSLTCAQGDVEQRAMAVYIAVRNSLYNGQAILDLWQVLAPGVTAVYAAAYRQALCLGLNLTAAVTVSQQTVDRCGQAAAKEKGPLGPGKDLPYTAREADYLSGALGCDRDTVTAAQQAAAAFARQTALSRATNALSSLLQALADLGCTTDAIGQVPTGSPENQILAQAFAQATRA